MIITVNEFLNLNIERENIETDYEYHVDNVKMFAGNTKIIGGEVIKERAWEMRTNALTDQEALTAMGILINLGDFWSFNQELHSGKGQKATFETDVNDPSEPTFVTGTYTSALRLNDYDMILNVYLEPMYLLSFYRQLVEFDDRFYHYIFDGITDRVWIEGELASEEEITEHGINDWLEINTIDNEVIFKSEAGDVDEVYVMSGVSYTENLFTAQDVYNVGELPMNGPYQYIEGNFLDDDETGILCEVIIDSNQWENIGKSNQIRFRLEEKI